MAPRKRFWSMDTRRKGKNVCLNGKEYEHSVLLLCQPLSLSDSLQHMD